MKTMSVVIAPGIDIGGLEAIQKDRLVLIERGWERGSFLALGEAFLQSVEPLNVHNLMLACIRNGGHRHNTGKALHGD